MRRIREDESMTRPFADRMSCVHKSFVREILKVTEDPDVISFAGGLPNPRCFPVQEIRAAAKKVLSECGEGLFSTLHRIGRLSSFAADDSPEVCQTGVVGQPL
jgi:2-aminoadipate transaminase